MKRTEFGLWIKVLEFYGFLYYILLFALYSMHKAFRTQRVEFVLIGLFGVNEKSIRCSEMKAFLNYISK